MKTPAAPSRSLLRFLRSQTDTIFTTSISPTRSPHARYLNTTSTQCSRIQATSIDAFWQRHRDACKALPAPRCAPPNPPQSRSTSSGSHSPGFWLRWLRRRQATARSKLPPEPPGGNSNYDETSAQLFNLSRALSRNPTGADLKLRCTEFDANGSVTMVAGEFRKSELIAKYGLLPRDLRKIDSSIHCTAAYVQPSLYKPSPEQCRRY